MCPAVVPSAPLAVPIPHTSTMLARVRPCPRAAVLAAFLAVACGAASQPSHQAPPPRPRSRAAAPARAPATSVAAPSPPSAVAYETYCREPSGDDVDAVADRLDDEGYGFDFPAVPLRPLPFGPRVAEMPRTGPRRTLVDLHEALERQTEHMNACYRWARYRQSLETVSVDASFTVDPFGFISHVVVSQEHPELAACVQEGLEAMRVSLRTPRLTDAHVHLRFEPSGLGRPSRAPLRPRRSPAPPGASVASCIQQPVSLPVDELGSDTGDPVARFDDWNADQEREEWERAHPGRGYPTDCCGCTMVSFRSPPGEIERTIRANLGAYRQCYREALRADPGLAGELAVQSILDDTGLFRRVQVEGVGAEGLHACFAAAFEELQVQPATIGQITVRYTFTLTPELPAPAQGSSPLERAELRLAELDAAGAAQDFRQWLGDHPEAAAQCRGYLGLLRAQLARAPWVDDPRVWQATQDFVKRAVSWEASREVKRCLEDAGPLVARVATWPYQLFDAQGWRYPSLGRWHSGAYGGDGRDAAWKRVQGLLELGDAVPGRELLLEFAGMVHADRGDPYEARQALVPVLAQRLPPKQVEVILEELAAGARRRALRDSVSRVLRPADCYPPLQ